MNNNLFIEYTTKYINFSLSIDAAKEYLLQILQDNKYSTMNNICQIDFEKLIFIDYHYSDNETINSLLKEIKKQISENYQYKQQLLNRLILKNKYNG